MKKRFKRGLIYKAVTGVIVLIANLINFVERDGDER